MDLAFQRLPWGGTHNPIMPNTIEVQLTYARLYENDAESGFPWDDTTYLIGNGFLRGLQGFLYILYMSVGGGFNRIIGWISNRNYKFNYISSKH